MPSPRLPVLTVLYVAGLALLALAFFLLVPSSRQDDSAYLELCVLAVVFTLNFPVVVLGWAKADGQSSRLTGLSIRWFTLGLYTPAALLGVVLGMAYAVPFRVQIVYQLAFLFGLAVAFALASRASSNTERVEGEEKAKNATLVEIRATATSVEKALLLLGPAWQSSLDAVRRLLEDARFLAPSNRNNERDLEASINAELRAIRILLDATDVTVIRPDLESRLANCSALMSLRRKPNVRQGES